MRIMPPVTLAPSSAAACAAAAAAAASQCARRAHCSCRLHWDSHRAPRDRRLVGRGDSNRKVLGQEEYEQQRQRQRRRRGRRRRREPIVRSSTQWSEGGGLNRSDNPGTPNGAPISLSNGAAQVAEVETVHPAQPEEAEARAPVDVRSVLVGRASRLEAGVAILEEAVRGIEEESAYRSHEGLLRLEVQLPPSISCLEWLRAQKGSVIEQGLRQAPRVYWSARRRPGEVMLGGETREIAGLGACRMWRGDEVIADGGEPEIASACNSLSSAEFSEIERWLGNGDADVHVIGGMRFDAAMAPEPEWAEFGRFCFILPRIELAQVSGCLVMAAHISWDMERSIADDIAECRRLIGSLVEPTPLLPWSGTETQGVKHLPSREQWDSILERVLWDLSKAQSADDLEKVVLARRSLIHTAHDEFDVLSLVGALAARSGSSSAYQFCLQLESGNAFFGNSPERLFCRRGRQVWSEAVAGTRAKSRDGTVAAAAAAELLSSPKEHAEFHVVHSYVETALSQVADGNPVDVPIYKEVMRQGSVQHLYSILTVNLQSHSHLNDLRVLTTLHPTPAVCGFPRNMALERLRLEESFDRGLYAGPFGFFSRRHSEFCVALRSGLVQHHSAIDLQGLHDSSCEEGQHPKARVDASSSGSPDSVAKSNKATISLYAGVGVVSGSRAESEWDELNLKLDSTSSFLVPPPSCKLSHQLGNTNQVWGMLVVEELRRQGVVAFCIAPGSRSGPLATAAAANPHVETYVGVDERSLGFFALGMAKCKNAPVAVITTSGTAVSNLVPSFTEAYSIGIPIIALTADRPPEALDCGDNQTTDHMGILSAVTRWQFLAPCPASDLSPRPLLTALAYATARARSDPCPVHINIPLREPLFSFPGDAPSNDGDGVEDELAYWDSTPWRPFSLTSFQRLRGLEMSHDYIWDDLVKRISSLEEPSRVLIVVGNTANVEFAWTASVLAERCNWPVYADVGSGLRVPSSSSTRTCANVIEFMDHMHVEEALQPLFEPAIVIQFGSFLVSKRLKMVLEKRDLYRIIIQSSKSRTDPLHRSSAVVVTDTPSDITARLYKKLEHYTSACFGGKYLALLKEADAIALDVLQSAFAGRDDSSPSLKVDETEAVRSNSVLPLKPKIIDLPARITEIEACCLAADAARESDSIIFLGNSMPIRDVDMYSSASGITKFAFAHQPQNQERLSLGPRVYTNRGVSGIDGLISTAAGIAAQAGDPVVAIIGDVSFIHDLNGLQLVSSFSLPIKIVVINNAGGRIFEMLPVAKVVEKSEFQEVFLTSPNASIEAAASMYGLQHNLVSTKVDLLRALRTCPNGPAVIEVVTAENAAGLRKALQKTISKELLASFEYFRAPGSGSEVITNCRTVSFSTVLSKNVTAKGGGKLRKGAYIDVFIDDVSGAYGRGEASPLPGISRESIEEVEEQLVLVSRMLQGKQVPYRLCTCNRKIFDAWLQSIGIDTHFLFPSVTVALEMAILNALAASAKVASLQLIGNCKNNVKFIPIAALVDNSNERSVEAIVQECLSAGRQGYRAIKLKVGRRSDITEEVFIIQSVANALKELGDRAPAIRLDANRLLSLQAACFLVKALVAENVEIEYIEEPCSSLSAMEYVYQASKQRIRIALDETLDELWALAVKEEGLKASLDTGLGSDTVAALVLKPTLFGGLAATAEMASWARGVFGSDARPVISAAFESEVALRYYAESASRIDLQFGFTDTVHGLGTATWLPSESQELLGLGQDSKEFGIRLSSDPDTAAGALSPDSLHSSLLTRQSLTLVPQGSSFERATTLVDDQYLVKYACKIGGEDEASPAIVLLHGFLGTVRDWEPVGQALGLRADVVIIDLNVEGLDPKVEMKDFAKILNSALSTIFGSRPMMIMGYSMGARVAIEMAVENPAISEVISISGNPGVRGVKSRKQRALEDELLAKGLRETQNIGDWLRRWYSAPLWDSLRRHPSFNTVLSERESYLQSSAAAASRTADLLECLSVGKAEPRWDFIADEWSRFVFVVGSCDEKYKEIVAKLGAYITTRRERDSRQESRRSDSADEKPHPTIIELPGGHNLLVESPLAILQIARAFCVRRHNL